MATTVAAFRPLRRLPVTSPRTRPRLRSRPTALQLRLRLLTLLSITCVQSGDSEALPQQHTSVGRSNGGEPVELSGKEPSGQQPAQFGDTRYTYRTRSPLPEQNEEYLIKTDHQITPSHRLTLSYFLLNYKVRVVPTTFTQVWSYSNYANKQQKR